eukprot:scaffold3044_cov123-Skeletonema_marinoi.AAC.6
MNKLSCAAILLASAAVGTQAQDMCSCSPTTFNFLLDFSNNCEVNTIDGNPGVQTAMCFQEVVDAVPGQPASDEPMRRLLRESEHDEDEPRSLQTGEDKVVEVVSAQFLEFGTDGDMTVIHQDNTYTTTSLLDGGAMQFDSVSSKLDTSVPLADQMENPALVPGGASLILYGKTESGKVIRNRFFWLYEMTNCGRENKPVQVGDQIGWVKVEPGPLGGAWPAFCPALPDGSPTISPRTNDPTLTPSSAPIEKLPTVTPTAKPVITDAPVTTDAPTDAPQSSSLIPGPSPTRKPTHPVFGSKSAKSKSLKPPHSAKSSKSKSAKNSSKSSKSNYHGYLNAHIVYEDFKMMNSSSMLSSFGISLITLAVTFYLSGGL